MHPSSISTPNMSQSECVHLIQFLHLITKLKTTKRSGWLQNNINQPESIADHMYRMSIIAFALPIANRSKLIKLALVHDLAESIVGDITPLDNISKQQKFTLEHNAMLHIRDNVLHTTPFACELYQLWLEYEHVQSEEALIVKDIDKFEMLLQAHEYETNQNIQLHQFFNSTKSVFRTPLIIQLDKQLRQNRQNSLTTTTTTTTTTTPCQPSSPKTN